MAGEERLTTGAGMTAETYSLLDGARPPAIHCSLLELKVTSLLSSLLLLDVGSSSGCLAHGYD